MYLHCTTCSFNIPIHVQGVVLTWSNSYYVTQGLGSGLGLGPELWSGLWSGSGLGLGLGLVQDDY